MILIIAVGIGSFLMGCWAGHWAKKEAKKIETTVTTDVKTVATKTDAIKKVL